jgi:hypothetical protein
MDFFVDNVVTVFPPFQPTTKNVRCDNAAGSKKTKECTITLVAVNKQPCINLPTNENLCAPILLLAEKADSQDANAANSDDEEVRHVVRPTAAELPVVCYWYARILLFSMDFFVDNVVTVFPPFQPTIGRSEVWFVHLCGQMFRFFCEYWSGNWYVLLSGIFNPFY